MKTSEVRQALRARHAISDGGLGGAWINIEEAFKIDFLAMACHGNWKDGNARRRADAIYPWIGYEIKVSRNDFLNEIRKPHKRRKGVAITNQFFFAAPTGLIKPHEIPPDCGLVEVSSGGSRVKVQAPITKAEPLTNHEIAVLLRHGINPSWIRKMHFAKLAAKYREATAEQAVEDAAATRDRVIAVLGARLAHTIEKGQVWRPVRHDTMRWFARKAETVLIVDVTDTTVSIGSGMWSYNPRLSVGEFLLDFEQVEEAAAVAA